jgi:low temperature requirement protein LtrA
MIAVFIACLAIPELFHETLGGWSAAATVVVCYAVVRLAHASFYLLAARGDPRLRRQVIITIFGSVVPTIILLTFGVIVGEPAQLWIWLAAVLYDFAAVFVTAVRGTGWRINSAAHFAERHGLIVILALGESIVAVGAGLAGEPIDARIALGAFLSLMVSLGLWFAYFRGVAQTLEHALQAAKGRARVLLGQDVFTYFHFPIIAGILLSALGAEQAMAHVDEEHLGPLGGWSLCGGVALFLAGTIAAAVRSAGNWMPLRIGVIVVLLALSPLLAMALPLVSVGIVAAVVLALAAIDTIIGARRPGRRWADPDRHR